MGSLLRHQADIGNQNPMPTDRVDDASTVSTATSETVVWSFVSSGAWAAAVGEAAGTICTSKLTYTGVLNSMNSAVGSYNDTSLSLGATTRFDTLVSIPETIFSEIQFMSPTDQKAAVTRYLTTNGYYAIDHRRGQLWGIAKATVANDAATYDYMAPIAGSGGAGGDVNIIKVAGDTVAAANTARTTATKVVPTQPIDEAGNILGKTAANTARTTATKVQPNQEVDPAGNVITFDTAGADAASNTSKRNPVIAWLVGFNGTTWDRLRTAVTTVSATLTGFLNTLPWAVYNATPATRTEGQGGPLQSASTGHLLSAEGFAPQAEDNTNGVIATQNKPLAVSTYAWSTDNSAALEASTVTKASAGILRSVAGRVNSTHASGTYYIQCINAASLPADGAVTLLRAPLKIIHTLNTDSNFSIDCTDNGIYASTGIVIDISTTEWTKTISGAFLSTTVLYK